MASVPFVPSWLTAIVALSTAVVLCGRSASAFSPSFVSHSVPRKYCEVPKIAVNHDGFQAPRLHAWILRASMRSSSPEDAIKRTAEQLERMQKNGRSEPSSGNEALDRLYDEYIRQSANYLKSQLKSRKMLTSGRKPDLARRLAVYELRQQGEEVSYETEEMEEDEVVPWNEEEEGESDAATVTPLKTFCGLRLSETAGMALGKAKFDKPTPIQEASIARLANGESLILHAQTGSGKSLSYLLPITEALWAEHKVNPGRKRSGFDLGLGGEQDGGKYPGIAFILTPTRELAAQIAGVATALAPPGSVRLVSYPTDLASHGQNLKDRIGRSSQGRFDDSPNAAPPRIFVGSAKAIMSSLYGDGKMPASPTRKPQARQLLQNTRWLVLDEVDRLLHAKTKADNANNQRRVHEKPAAIIASAVARLTLGRAQVMAASATVGRPLKRELSRVLGLSPQECPKVVRGMGEEDTDDDMQDLRNEKERHRPRAVTIPDTVRNYVTAVDTSTVGKLLTSAFFIIKSLNKSKPNRRMLLVMTKGSDINTQTTVAALRHFKCKPDPVSLLDALEATDSGGTDEMMRQHQLVSGAIGVGESSYFQDASKNDDGYLFVTGEDSVRGLHLDALDVVIVVGRPKGPDEYTHIAGRTGRAGRPGTVLNVLSHDHEKAVKGWETMLNVQFERIGMDDIENL